MFIVHLLCLKCWFAYLPEVLFWLPAAEKEKKKKAHDDWMTPEALRDADEPDLFVALIAEGHNIKKVKVGSWDFRGTIWDTISEQAKDLISCLLKKDPEQRLSAVDALQHPWI